MQQEDENDYAGHQRLLQQRLLKRVDGFLHDVGAVVEGHNFDFRDAAIGERLLRQAQFQLFAFFLNPFDDVLRVFAVTHQNHAADGLHPRFVQRTPPELRAKIHGRDVFDLNGRAAFLPDHDLLQIFDRFDESDATDEELDAIFLKHLRAHINVRLAHGLVHVHERDAVARSLSG
jgi:hypothetical protein